MSDHSNTAQSFAGFFGPGTLPPIDAAERQRRMLVVTRIAIGAATNNGDPILQATHILSKSTIMLPPRTAEDLDANQPAAVDASGGRYFPYVRTDGRGQINVIWTDGRETTFKFLLPEAFLTNPVEFPQEFSNEPLAPDSSKSGGESWVASGQWAVDLLTRNSGVFVLLAIAFVMDLVGAGKKIIPSGGSFFLGSFLIVAYFLGSSTLARLLLFRKPLHWALALVIVSLLYVGWFAVYDVLIGGQYRPSLLFALCAVASFRALRLVESDRPSSN